MELSSVWMATPYFTQGSTNCRRTYSTASRNESQNESQKKRTINSLDPPVTQGQGQVTPAGSYFIGIYAFWTPRHFKGTRGVQHGVLTSLHSFLIIRESIDITIQTNPVVQLLIAMKQHCWWLWWYAWKTPSGGLKLKMPYYIETPISIQQ